MSTLKTIVLILALGHVIFGLYGLYAPEAVGAIVSLQPTTGGAVGELRAIFGGLIVATGVALLRGALGGSQGKQWLLAVAVAYAGLFVGRVVSIGMDGRWAHTLLAGLVEAAIAGFLVYAAWELGKPATVDAVAAGADD